MKKNKTKRKKVKNNKGTFRKEMRDDTSRQRSYYKNQLK